MALDVMVDLGGYYNEVKGGVSAGASGVDTSTVGSSIGGSSYGSGSSGSSGGGILGGVSLNDSERYDYGRSSGSGGSIFGNSTSSLDRDRYEVGSKASSLASLIADKNYNGSAGTNFSSNTGYDYSNNTKKNVNANTDYGISVLPINNNSVLNTDQSNFNAVFTNPQKSQTTSPQTTQQNTMKAPASSSKTTVADVVQNQTPTQNQSYTPQQQTADITNSLLRKVAAEQSNVEKQNAPVTPINNKNLFDRDAILRNRQNANYQVNAQNGGSMPNNQNRNENSVLNWNWRNIANLGVNLADKLRGSSANNKDINLRDAILNLGVNTADMLRSPSANSKDIYLGDVGRNLANYIANIGVKTAYAPDVVFLPDNSPNGYVLTNYLRENPGSTSMLFPTDNGGNTAYHPITSNDIKNPYENSSLIYRNEYRDIPFPGIDPSTITKPNGESWTNLFQPEMPSITNQPEMPSITNQQDQGTSENNNRGSLSNIVGFDKNGNYSGGYNTGGNNYDLQLALKNGKTSYDKIYNDYVNSHVGSLYDTYVNELKYSPEQAQNQALETAQKQAYQKIYELGYRPDYTSKDSVNKYVVPSLIKFVDNLERSINNNYYTNPASYDDRYINMISGGIEGRNDQLFYDLTSQLAGNAYLNQNSKMRDFVLGENNNNTVYPTTPKILNTSDINNPNSWNTALQAAMSGDLTKDQILHFYDANYSDLVIPEATRKYLASDSTHSIQELFLNMGQNKDRTESVKGTDKELNEAFEALINANPELKLMIDNNVLTKEDILYNFFKNVDVENENENANNSYGSGRGSSKKYNKRSYINGGGNSRLSHKHYGSSSSDSENNNSYGSGSGSGSRGSGSLSGSGSSSSSQYSRIHNIMKNWKF